MTERLLAALRSHANQRGLVMVREQVLLRELDVSRDEIAPTLLELERAGILELLSPFPYLVVKLLKWSGRTASARDSERASRNSHVGVPVSSSNAAAASSKQEDGGAGEGEALLRDVVSALEENDEAELRELIAKFPAPVVRHALRRVQATPASQIRKSKTALFRYLLAKLS